MRKLRSALCLACLLVLVPLLLLAWRVLPVDSQPLIEKKYAGWSGVLRLWIFEGWPSGSGSLSQWLNRCIGRFEKRRPGVYVQPQYVDADTLADFNESGLLPPDMLLFPTGLLDSPEGLVTLPASNALRPSLARCGRWGDSIYAAPVAMGGYLWAWNRSLIDGIPDDWRESDSPPVAPEPEPWRHWDAALLALCAGRAVSPEGAGDSQDMELPGLDLGLSASSAPSATPSPSPSSYVTPRRLPNGFGFSGDAWRQFINGDSAAIPVSQREIRRLTALSEQGKGPDWQLSPGDAIFSDQLLCLSVVDKADAEAQQTLCLEFLSLLLEDESQEALHAASAFSVTASFSGYASGDPLAILDAALHGDELTVPACFDTDWADAARETFQDFIENKESSSRLWLALRNRLSKNPNISG